MKLKFSPLAEDDLEVIADYIARDNPKRALTFINEIRKQCHMIASNPSVAPFRKELGQSIRMWVYKRYLIFYSVGKQPVRVERVLHGARDMAALFDA